ncbi:MAG: aldehyde dehydrogenase family protein, partial [Proteobacteria bacterium]|nr:aldehyde dehydrogenase family protein [Pseudomonadota bacterium]
IKEVPFNNEEQADAALALAYKTYLDRDRWMTPYRRISILEKAIILLEERKEQLAKEAAEEGGKPFVDSLVEANRAVSCVKVAIEQISHLNGKQIPMNITESSAHRMAYTYREPVGVVLAISAFNHPLNLIAHQVVTAVASGCPVIVKPATSTPISCFNFVNILYEAGLPLEWCQIIACDNAVAERMVSDTRISYLSFIGSSKVGWYLRTKLASGAKCVLEHGGAAPVIVEADADMSDALPLLVKGGFYHAGQVCVSVQRVYVHEKICKVLAKQMADLASALIVGDPVDPKTEVGPLIATKEVDRVDNWVKQAITNGAKLLCGGNKISNTCYEPTVLLDPPDDVQVSQLEIFGPVVCIYSYKSREKAIERANKLPFSFQASVFTKNIDIALDTVRRLNAVAVMVNDHTAFRVDWMPFGGRKQSGLGLGGIPYTMEDMTYEKMMVIRSSVL